MTIQGTTCTKAFCAPKPLSCPRMIFDCGTCGQDEECVFLEQTATSCPKPVCKLKETVVKRAKPLKPLSCPRIKLECAHECGESEECIFSKQTETECPQALCRPKQVITVPSTEFVEPLNCPLFKLDCGNACAHDEICSISKQTPNSCPQSVCKPRIV
jgi:hypothetical protein